MTTHLPIPFFLRSLNLTGNVCGFWGMESFALMCDKCNKYDTHTFCRVALMDDHTRSEGLLCVPRGQHMCFTCKGQGHRNGHAKK